MKKQLRNITPTRLTTCAILFSFLLLVPLSIPSLKAAPSNSYATSYRNYKYTATYSEGSGSKSWYGIPFAVSYTYSRTYISVTWPDYSSMVTRGIAGTVYMENAFNRVTGDI